MSIAGNGTTGNLTLTGSAPKLQADSITNSAGTGAVSFPNGVSFASALNTLTDANQTLTTTSSAVQRMTPTAARNIKLDSSFTIGQQLTIVNLASPSTAAAIITLQANDNSTIATIYQGMAYQVLCNTTSPGGVAQWDGLSIIESQRIAYTPTFGASWGVVTEINFWYRRFSDIAEISGNFKMGATTTGSSSISIPSGFVIDLTKVKSSTGNTDSTVVGSVVNASATQVVSLLINNNTTTNVLGVGYWTGSSASQFVAANNFGTVNGYMSVIANIPITGWSQTKG